MQLREALVLARQKLAPVSDSASLDARVLMADTLGVDSSWILAHADEPLPTAAELAFAERLDRLVGGEPLPYVLGWWEFYGRRFAVAPGALIPRPETELLIEVALKEIGRRPATRAIDIGTGTGCIAVTLAAERPSLSVIATDLSRAALAVAQKNVVANGVKGRVQLIQASVLDGVRGEWDLVCANLPYLPTARLDRLSVARHEPRVALDGGPRGMGPTVDLLRSLPDRLAQGGLALLEIDEDQAEELADSAREILGEIEIEVMPDLAGKSRLLHIRRSRSVR